MMNDTRVMSMEELQVFLNSSGSLEFDGYSRTEAYAWIEKILRQYKYLARPGHRRASYVSICVR